MFIIQLCPLVCIYNFFPSRNNSIQFRKQVHLVNANCLSLEEHISFQSTLWCFHTLNYYFVSELHSKLRLEQRWIWDILGDLTTSNLVTSVVTGGKEAANREFRALSHAIIFTTPVMKNENLVICGEGCLPQFRYFPMLKALQCLSKAEPATGGHMKITPRYFNINN